MTDLVQLARDTLTASEKATDGEWWEDTSIRDGMPIVMASKGLVARLERQQLSMQEADAEFIALMRTVGPLLAQHVLDLREALEHARGHLNVGSEAWEILDAALAEKEPK